MFPNLKLRRALYLVKDFATYFHVAKERDRAGPKALTQIKNKARSQLFSTHLDQSPKY